MNFKIMIAYGLVAYPSRLALPYHAVGAPR